MGKPFHSVLIYVVGFMPVVIIQVNSEGEIRRFPIKLNLLTKLNESHQTDQQ